MRSYQRGFAETNQRAAELPVARDIGGAEDSKLDLQFPTDGSMGLEEMQSEIVGKMLARYNGNVTEVARILKTTREKLRYRIEIYHLR